MADPSPNGAPRKINLGSNLSFISNNWYQGAVIHKMFIHPIWQTLWLAELAPIFGLILGLYLVFRKKKMTISAYFPSHIRSYALTLSMALSLALAFVLVAPDQGRAEVATLSEATSEKVLGSADAKIEMHEYASLTCSHCANFHNNAMPEIKKNFIDTGKVRLIYHDFPLDDLALAASMLARCSGNDNFFPMLNTLYKSQSSWARAENPLASLTGISRMIGGMNETDVKTCLDNNDLYWDIAGKRTEAGEKLGIKSTPTFFINGRKIEGALAYEDFRDILNKMLDQINGI